MIVENEATVRAGRLSEARQALLEKRLRGETRANPPAPALRRRAATGPVALSSAQRRLWFFQQLEPACSVYNMPLTLRLTGRLDVPALRAALDAIVARHEILRTRIVAETGEPRQVIGAPAPVPLTELDLRGEPPAGREERLAEALARESRRPFDLAADLMLRSLLVRLADDEHVLLLLMHHIASDGWSLGVLFQELSQHYEAARAGRPPALPALPVQFADYAAWEQEWLAGPACARQAAYWKTRLAGAPAELELPTDRVRPPVQTFNGRWELLPLPRELLDALTALSRLENATLFMTLLAAFQVLLHRYTGQTDLVIGTPVAGRMQSQTEGLIGFFVNTLPLRADLAGNPAFLELLRRVRNATIEDLANQELPFDRLVEGLRLPRDPRHAPLLQAVFVMQNTPPRAMHLPGLEVQELPARTDTAKFDLTLSIEDTPGGRIAALEYNTDLFAPATAARLLGHYRTLLEAVAADPDRAIGDLPLLTAAEQAQLHAWNDTARDFPRHETVHRLVEAQVARAPDAVALVCGDRTMTYGELDRRANQLARRLRRLGVGRDMLVALCLERSPEMIVALLGILKAGGAYASLDPAYPAERLAFMLADSQAPVVLTTAQLAAVLPSPPAGATAPAVLRLDTDWPDIAREDPLPPDAGVAAENLAYVSYTSGSTGRPKGVCITHRAVNRLLLNTDYIALGPDDAVAQISNCAFDASTFEIWGALLHGARLVIVPAQVVLTPRDFAATIAAQGVTTLFVTTALFNQLAHVVPDFFRPLRHVLFGGEAVHPASVRAVLRHGPPQRLLHVYGPTETTTFATWHEVREVPPDATTIPIGRPLANTTLFVLDDARRPVPAGVPGELYIGGDGLARGYLRRPELDAVRFVPYPFGDRPGDRLYRTGDRVRWLADGTIEFLGRMDRQVKIRGHRIEPEEIESVLESHPAVEQAVVLVRETGGAEDSPGQDRRLVAYVVPESQPAPTPAELRAHLQQKLPEYMVPAAFVLLTALPLNANGKLEPDALPAPELPVTDISGPAAPRTDTERRLATLWAEVLGVPRIGRDDNFFDLGGHSLAGVRLFARIEREFGRRVPLAALFQAPTVAQLARRIMGTGDGATGSSLVVLQPHGPRPPVFFVHGAGAGNLWTYTNLVPHLDPDQPVYALESRTMRGLEEFPRIEDMAAHYREEIRAVQPHGPYYLGGYCFGGNVAYEIARQFEAAGESVALLALLDSAPANGVYHRIPWWNPLFIFRFGLNTAYWLQDFLGQQPAERRRFVRRKLRTLGRQLTRGFRGGAQTPGDIDLNEVIDVARFPAEELQLWKIHLHALWTYQPGPYRGRVTLFRTRGQPFLCSFDPRFGWGSLASGGVEVVKLPGAHEQIFMEPHVRVLSARLRACLRRAQGPATLPASSTLHPLPA